MRDATADIGVLVPVKAFGEAKQRLAGVLSDRERAALARWCAERVLAAARPLATHVVCDDDDVAEWAEGLGATVLWCPGVGLNAAIHHGTAEVANAGFAVAMVVHGDLPLAHDLGALVIDPAQLTVIPDHRYDGTNVLALPTPLADRFAFQYGRRSFLRHVHEAVALGTPVRVVRDEALSHDLDTPDDLDDPRMGDVREWLRTSPASPR